MKFRGSRLSGFLIAAAGLLLLGSTQVVQTEQAGARVEIDGDDIGGVETASATSIVPSESPVTRDNTPWSPYWGDEPVWRRQSEPRSLAMDGEGRAWLSAIVREVPRQNPAFCTSPENEYARHFPLSSRSRRALPRQASLYDPETDEFTSIGDVCTSLDHNQFGPDDYIYFGSRDVVFWIDTPRFLETRAAESVPDGVLLALGQWPHRRSEHRLEGPGALVEFLDLHALARRGRVQRRGQCRQRVEGGEVPDAPAPTREVGRGGRSKGPTAFER